MLRAEGPQAKASHMFHPPNQPLCSEAEAASPSPHLALKDGCAALAGGGRLSALARPVLALELHLEGLVGCLQKV